MSQPRTHYQISLTSRQAVGAFLGLLVSLALAFFFGLMAGSAGRSRAAAEPEAASAPAPEREPASDASAAFPVETAVPTVPTGPLGSRTELAAGPTAPPAEPTAPATLHPFEDADADASGDESSPVTAAVGGKGAGAARPSEKPAPPADKASGKYWVQVASLSSRDEASALSTRLTRKGFRAQILTATGPKGKGKVYRVRVGPYRTEDDADRAAGKLSKQENVKSPWVVPDGQ